MPTSTFVNATDEHRLGRRVVSAGFLVVCFLLAVNRSEAQRPIDASRTALMSVADVIRRARSDATGSQVAKSGVLIAERLTGLLRSGILPTLSVEASGLRQTLNVAAFGFPGRSAATEPFNVFSVGVRASQALLDASTWRRIGVARDSARAAASDASSTADLSATAAAAAYYRLLAAGAALDGRRADSVLAADVLREIGTRRRVGEATDIDVTRARLGAIAASARVTDATAAATQSRLDLAVALAMSPVQLPDIRDSLRLPQPDERFDMNSTTAASDSLVQRFIAQRPDVVASLARVRSGSGLQAARRLEYVPRITAFGEYQSTGVELGVLHSVYRVGVQASLPLLDGFGRKQRAGIDEQRLRILQVLDADVRRRAAREIQGALVELERALSTIAVSDEQFTVASDELTQARRRVQVGVGTTLETTQGIAGVAAARDQVIGARLRYRLARLEWHRATATLDAIR